MYSRVTEELCDCALERADGSTVEATVELAGKIVALYFSGPLQIIRPVCCLVSCLGRSSAHASVTHASG